MLRFLHTSDIHLLRLDGVTPWRYLNKRLTGRLNLALHRGKKQDQSLFDRMVEQVEALALDRFVVTGDLTNLALESEFELCVEKFETIPVPLTVIPGNHDTYTRGSERTQRFEHYMAPYMQGEREGGDYPFVQRFDDVALVGVSSAVATPPFDATGQCGAAQLGRLRRMLTALGEEGLARVVLVHHPPVDGLSKPNHALTDRAAFGEVIAAAGAELILHGHEHVNSEASLPGPDGPVPVHGIASGTSRLQKPGRAAAFSVYDVSSSGFTRELYEWNGTRYASPNA
ncbi:MAG: metallophosphoesterase family protein [Nannocystaceae bacterium]|nr:metallophosphoesterase [bacterium]